MPVHSRLDLPEAISNRDAAETTDFLTFQLRLCFDARQEMGKKRITAKKLANMEAANRFIQGMNKLLCIGLAVAFGLLIAATAAPQKRELTKLETKLRAVQAREDETLARKEHKEIELQALLEVDRESLLRDRIAGGEKTDVFASANLEHPRALAVGADYGLVVLRGTGEAAHLLALHILSPEEQRVLARHGFNSPGLPAFADAFVPVQAKPCQ